MGSETPAERLLPVGISEKGPGPETGVAQVSKGGQCVFRLGQKLDRFQMLAHLISRRKIPNSQNLASSINQEMIELQGNSKQGWMLATASLMWSSPLLGH